MALDEFLLCMEDILKFLKILQKGPPPTHFSDPTCLKFRVLWLVMHDSNNLQA